jgi:NDP-sugar pyrophosphorylase family protein
MLPVAILAGGLATRLKPLTDRTPKALLGIAGRPFILHQLELLKRQGAERIVLCLGHLAEQIQTTVGDGTSLGLDIGYSWDGPVPLGTGGAVRRALPLLGPAFFVLNGDSYLRCPLAAIAQSFRACGKPALMTVLRNDGRWERSNVLMQDGELIEYDKRSPRPAMAHIDYGLGAFGAELFAPLPASEPVDLADICRSLSLQGRLAAYEVTQRCYEIGSHEGIRDTEALLSRAAGAS